jgi:hypothetical protein
VFFFWLEMVSNEKTIYKLLPFVLLKYCHPPILCGINQKKVKKIPQFGLPGELE